MEPEDLEIAHYIRAALVVACALVTAAIAEEAELATPPWLDGYRVRYELNVAGDVWENKQKAAIARLPTGGWCRPDASDITVQAPDGSELPVAILGHAPDGHTLVQFAIVNKQKRYWAYVGHPTAKPARREPLPEGLTLEVRQWQGDSMDSWADVRKGLDKSTNVLGTYLVGDILQNSNPARPSDPKNFAASYRGWINIPKDGVYRFFVNSDDAVFLFINDFLVCERTGSNAPRRGRLPIKDVGNTIELTEGVHRIEVHHVVGNNHRAYGLCAMVWIRAEEKQWAFVPHATYAKSNLARVVGIESAPQSKAAAFVYGIEDTLTTVSGMKIFLVRFAAIGKSLPADEQIVWDFGDGTKGTGRSVTHLYFEEDDYKVSLTVSGKQPAFKQNVHVWPAPSRTSPFSPGKVIDLFAATDWRKGDPERVYQMFDFLLISEQRNRWPLVEQITEFLLAMDDPDPRYRSQLYTQRIEALARLGKADDALKVAEKAKAELQKVSALKLEIQLAEARVHGRFLRQYASAARLYEAMLEEHRRLNDPLLRQAAVQWGDLCMQTGNVTQAAECYRLADTFGGNEFQATAMTEAVTRGALLRLAEQKLRAGDIRQTKSLLKKIEAQYPEQKLEGLYRFLSAETDRFGGEYEDALENYGVLLKLNQWAGLHDRAVFGVSDTYFRMGEYDRATKWLANLRKNFPRYGDPKELDELEALYKELSAFASGNGSRLTDRLHDFEPDAKDPKPKILRFGTAPGLGIVGSRVALADNHPKYRHYLDMNVDAKNLIPNGLYWIEMWYREDMVQGERPHQLHVHTWLRDEKNRMNPTFKNDSTRYINRTYGVWRRLGFLQRAPLALHGNLALSMRYNWGVVEFDGLRIRHVTDQQFEALSNFIEGVDEDEEAEVDN